MNENQVGVILEEVRDMFKALAEGQKILSENVAGLKQDMAVLKQDVAVLKQDVAVLKQDVARIDRKLDMVIRHTAGLTETVHDHEVRLTALEQKSVT